MKHSHIRRKLQRKIIHLKKQNDKLLQNQKENSQQELLYKRDSILSDQEAENAGVFFAGAMLGLFNLPLIKYSLNFLSQIMPSLENETTKTNIFFTLGIVSYFTAGCLATKLTNHTPCLFKTRDQQLQQQIKNNLTKMDKLSLNLLKSTTSHQATLRMTTLA